MLRTLSKLLIKATTQTFGIITLISLVHLFIVEYLGISPWLLSNVWGCACIFVFMDSIILANDLKVMEIKNKELEIKYNIMDISYKTEKLEFREREKAYLHKENILLNTLSNQSKDIQNDISSLNTSMVKNHMDVQRAFSCISSPHSYSQFSFNNNSEENTPDIHYSTVPCEIPTFKNDSFDSNSESSRNSMNIEERKDKFRDLAKQGRNLSLQELQMKKHMRYGLTQSSSEIIQCSKVKDNKNNIGIIRFKVDLTDVIKRSPSDSNIEAKTKEYKVHKSL